ncbi:MAG: GNAT family N-acetyltransferase [Acidobacteriota bacterium]
MRLVALIRSLRDRVARRGSPESETSSPHGVFPLKSFAPSDLATLQQAEAAQWQRLLDWDLSPATSTLADLIDRGRIDGRVLLEAGRPRGYCLFSAEGTKGVIGSFFLDPAERAQIRTLLHAAVEAILAKGEVKRVEAELPLEDQHLLTDVLGAVGFVGYPRLYMRRALGSPDAHVSGAGAGDHQIRAWRAEDLGPSAELLKDAYSGHLEQYLHLQYATSHGCRSFVEQLLKYTGCGTFDPHISLSAVHTPTGRMSAFLIGSRISQGCAHLPQVAVHPDHWGGGLGTRIVRHFVELCAARGYGRVTLNVTEVNLRAVALYRRLGFAEALRFNAYLLDRGSPAR